MWTALRQWLRTATGRTAEIAAARIEERAKLARELRTQALSLRRGASIHPVVRFQIGMPIAADYLEQTAKNVEG